MLTPKINELSNNLAAMTLEFAIAKAQAQKSGLREDIHAKHRAMEKMIDAQNDMWSACEEESQHYV